MTDCKGRHESNVSSEYVSSSLPKQLLSRKHVYFGEFLVKYLVRVKEI